MARAAFEGVVCGLLDGLDALGRAGVATGGRISVVGGGARFPEVLADLAARPVDIPDAATEWVALGAAVQAAAAATGQPVDCVARAWRDARGGGRVQGPSIDADTAAAVRAAYDAARG